MREEKKRTKIIFISEGRSSTSRFITKKFDEDRIKERTKFVIRRETFFFIIVNLLILAFMLIF